MIYDKMDKPISRREMLRSVPEVSYREHSCILIRDLDMKPLFVMDFYGPGALELGNCPGGGAMVARALIKRGILPECVTFNLIDCSFK